MNYVATTNKKDTTDHIMPVFLSKIFFFVPREKKNLNPKIRMMLLYSSTRIRTEGIRI